MKNILIVFILIISISCKSQQVYPLKTDYTEIPTNSYLKDVNNELNSFIGTYKTTFQNNEITLFITKLTYRFFDDGQYHFYKDTLSIKYIIKNSSGTILQDTENISLPAQQIRHTILSQWVEDNGNKLLLYYGGTNCGIGWGEIVLKKVSSTQLSWEYRPNDIILDSAKCPNGTDSTIYLPETKDLIFTKQ